MSTGVGLLGYGRWGENLARVFARSEGFSLAAICDVDAARRAQAGTRYPEAAFPSSLDDMLKMPSIAAMAIATPPQTLAKFARRAILGGRHVFLEKPGAMTPEAILALGAQARRAGVALMIDLTPAFSPLQDQLIEALRLGRVGPLVSWRAERINVAYEQPGVDVMRDLAIHDLAVLDSALGRSPSAIAARDVAFGPDGRLRQATILLQYADGFLAEIFASWDGSERVRRTTVVGDAGKIVRDDVKNLFAVSEVSKAVARSKKIIKPPSFHSRETEPLARAIGCFASCVENDEAWLANVDMTARILSWIVCAEKSIEANGAFLPLLAEAAQ